MEILIPLMAVLLVGVAGGLYFFYDLSKRAKKRYWELVAKEVEIQQRLENQQGQLNRLHEKMDKIRQHMDKIRQHLELEHLAELSSRARDKGLITPEEVDKALQALHEMEMDNWQGAK